MTQTTHVSAARPEGAGSLAKRMLIGAGIGLVFIAVFLLPIKHANPAWGPNWMVRPFLMVPAAGALGGLFFHLMQVIAKRTGWNKILLVFVGVLGFLVACFLGTVLGLDGTLWN